MLDVIMLNVIMLDVIMLTVVMLEAVAPKNVSEISSCLAKSSAFSIGVIILSTVRNAA